MKKRYFKTDSFDSLEKTLTKSVQAEAKAAEPIRNDEAMRRYLMEGSHADLIEKFKPFRDESLVAINGTVVDELDLMLSTIDGKMETYVTGQVIIDGVIHRILVGKADEIVDMFYPYYEKWSDTLTEVNGDITSIIKHIGPNNCKEISMLYRPDYRVIYSYNTGSCNSRIKTLEKATEEEYNNLHEMMREESLQDNR